MTELSRLFDNTPTGADRAGLGAAFDGTAPAETLPPIPPGEYLARWIASGMDESRYGTPFFLGRFEIASGEHAGRRLVHKWYLSPKAMPYSKRDLAALGLDTFAMLQDGTVPGGLVRLRVTLRRDDSGGTFNEVNTVLPHTQRSEPVASVPRDADPKPEPPAAPATADDLPAGLVDADLL